MLQANPTHSVAWSSERESPSPTLSEHPAPFQPLADMAVVAHPDVFALQPVTMGIPFARGLLPSAEHLQLVNEHGKHVGLQTETLARWSDGSVQWALLDFLVPESAPNLTLGLGGGDGMAPAINVYESSDTFVVDTGDATFRIDRSIFYPFLQVCVGGDKILDGSAVSLTDSRGKNRVPRIERSEVETCGSVRTTIRCAGTFADTADCRFEARTCFFAGTGLARLRFTIHNPNRARHRGGLWDLGDPNSMLFRDLSVALRLPEVDGWRTFWSTESGQPVHREDLQRLSIFQGSSGGLNWQSRNHVNRHGRVPCHLPGYVIQRDDHKDQGRRASPILGMENEEWSVSVAVPEFWQQFPKGVAAQGRDLRIGLFPEEFGDPFELQGGEQKTHEIWFHFGKRSTAPEAALAWVRDRSQVTLPASWYVGAGTFPCLTTRSTPYLDEILNAAGEGHDSVIARREIVDEYGWRNFGETYADHETAYYVGPKPIVSHYNNQYDSVNGALLQYLRTGNACWRELFDPLARHVMDVDVYHTQRDKAAYNGGLFWFTDHYLDAATCTHRTYTHKNRPADGTYGGGPGSEHNFTTGLLHYYYLTGNPMARAVVLELANWVLAMDDGRKTPFGTVDDGPTGMASATGSLAYQGPGRGAGNSINALLDAWLLTREQTYLDYAEVLIRRCIHPRDDVAAHDLLNVEKRWSYTVFLAALLRYLRLKVEARTIDHAYAYARASLVHYVLWMADHERPFFDRPQEMQYPTEVWAAQDLRKANVMRLAAAYVDEALRDHLLRRGEELADRGWHDLFRFGSRTNVRCVAIVMTEGVIDAWLRTHDVDPAPRPTQVYDFGQPESFVPQRLRVLAQCKSPRGIARACFRVLGAAVRRRRTAASTYSGLQ